MLATYFHMSQKTHVNPFVSYSMTLYIKGKFSIKIYSTNVASSSRCIEIAFTVPAELILIVKLLSVHRVSSSYTYLYSTHITYSTCTPIYNNTLFSNHIKEYNYYERRTIIMGRNSIENCKNKISLRTYENSVRDGVKKSRPKKKKPDEGYVQWRVN